MALDTSIYNNIQTPQMPDPLSTAAKAMSLGHLGMQNQQMQLQLQTQQAMRQAYQNNRNPDGSLNREGMLSALGRVNPQAAMEMQQSFVGQDKAKAEAQKSQAEAAHATLSLTVPVMQDLMTNTPVDQRATVWPNLRNQLIAQGIDQAKLPEQYDEGLFNHALYQGMRQKEYLDNQLTQANIGKTRAETLLAPEMAKAKLNNELYGSRSPNSELTSQYDKQAAPIRSSQNAMNQMLDNYNHPSPQGDASLVLNAFKIKFPNAPDVNSLKELSESQATPDQWKQMAHKALSGGLDKNTRDNLMRDGVSTFRANVDSLKGIQKRYQARQGAQNVNDPTLTAEPAIDKTYQEAIELQKQIGPYVPPTDRPGLLSSAKKAVSSLIDGNAENTASAGEKAQSKFRAAGAAVSADELAKYATRHGMKLKDAEEKLRGAGYVINR